MVASHAFLKNILVLVASHAYPSNTLMLVASHAYPSNTLMLVASHAYPSNMLVLVAYAPQHASVSLNMFIQQHASVGCLTCLSQHPSNILLCLRDGPALTIIQAATLKQKLRIKLSISPSHSIRTPGQTVPALTLDPSSKSLV